MPGPSRSRTKWRQPEALGINLGRHCNRATLRTGRSVVVLLARFNNPYESTIACSR